MIGSRTGIIGCRKNLAGLVAFLCLTCAAIISAPASADTPNLTVSGDDKAPNWIYMGEPHLEELNYIVFLKVTFTTNHSEGITLTNITFQRTGSIADENVEILLLYNDDNGNGQLDLETDTLLGKGSFFQKKAGFFVSRTVTFHNPLSVIVALNLSNETPSNKTLGIEIPDKSFIQTQETADIAFEFCICSKNSTVLLDSDGDLNPDSTDPDDDNDGYLDEIEKQSESDPLDPDSVPIDTDKDMVPDSLDSDDDDDGVPDEYDDFPKDPDRQRDYTLVIIYAVIAMVIIIVLVLAARARKPKRLDNEDLKEYDDEFNLDSMDDEPEEEDENDLLENEVNSWED